MTETIPAKEAGKQIINIKTSAQQKRPPEHAGLTKKGSTNFVTDLPAQGSHAELSVGADDQIYNYDSDDSYERIKDLARTTIKGASNDHFNTSQLGMTTLSVNKHLRSENHFDNLLS